MKIIEDNNDRLTVKCRRSVFADIVAAFCIVFGAVMGRAMVMSQMDSITSFVFAVCVIFVIAGAYLIWRNGSSQVTLDSQTCSVQFRWQHLSGAKKGEFPLSDLRDITLGDGSNGSDDEFRTLIFTRNNGEVIALQSILQANQRIDQVAQRMNDWVQEAKTRLATT